VMPTYTSYFTLNTATKSLNTGIAYLGGTVSAVGAGFLTDWRGRREAIFWSCVITLIGAVLMSSATHIAMFIVGRFIIGMGLGVAATATPTYVAETCPPKHRAFALGLYFSCWGVGTMIAAGICYRVCSDTLQSQNLRLTIQQTQHLSSTWAWRTPALVQVGPSIITAIILLFVPESPRWLVNQDRHAEALEVLAIVNAEGDKDDPLVVSPSILTHPPVYLNIIILQRSIEVFNMLTST